MTKKWLKFVIGNLNFERVDATSWRNLGDNHRNMELLMFVNLLQYYYVNPDGNNAILNMLEVYTQIN